MNIRDLMKKLNGVNKGDMKKTFDKAVERIKENDYDFSAFILATDTQASVCGSGADLLAIIAIVINNLAESGLPKEAALKCVEAAYMDDEELAKEAKKNYEKNKKDIEKLKTIVEILGKDTDDE